MCNRETDLSNTDLKPSGSMSSLPIGIVQDILVRLRVKFLLRCRAVCKEWCALIYNPSFVKDHLEKSLTIPFTGPAFLVAIQAYPSSTSECVFYGLDYSPPHVLFPNGGRSHPVFYSGPLSHGRVRTRLLQLPGTLPYRLQLKHINGLVLYHEKNGYSQSDFAYIVNPSSRSAQRVTPFPFPVEHNEGKTHICYFFGFDPTCNDYKILSIRLFGIDSNPSKINIQCGVFSLQSGSWKMVEPIFPFDILSEDWLEAGEENACVNGVIHTMLKNSYAIVSFDLRNDKFSIVEMPAAAVPTEDSTHYMELRFSKSNRPSMLNWNGWLAVACHEHVVFENKMEVWILKDFESQAWVMETITLPCSWMDFSFSMYSGNCLPNDFIVTGELMFSPFFIGGDCVRVRLYSIKTRTFRWLDIYLSTEFRNPAYNRVSSKLVSYVETIYPLRANV